MSDGRRSGFLNWKAALGIAISAGALWLALHDVDAGEVLHEIRRADPFWFATAVFFATIVFPLRAWRWQPLLEPVLPASTFRDRNAATCIGFMANNLLPARVGEFARAYALARLQPVTISASLGSIVVERLFDGVTVIALLFIGMAMPGFPAAAEIGGRNLSSYGLTMLAVLAVAIGLLFAMVMRPRAAVAVAEAITKRILPASFARPIVDALEAFLHGVAVLRRPVLVLRVAVASVVVWGASCVSFWAALRAFDIDAPLAAAVFLQAFIALAVAIPSAPGFFGLFEGAARLVLVGLFAVPVDKAIGFAIGFHMGGFIPITLIGLWYVWRLGLSWRDVETSEEVVEEAIETGDDGAAP